MLPCILISPTSSLPSPRSSNTVRSLSIQLNLPLFPLFGIFLRIFHNFIHLLSYLLIAYMSLGSLRLLYLWKMCLFRFVGFSKVEHLLTNFLRVISWGCQLNLFWQGKNQKHSNKFWVQKSIYRNNLLIF